MACKRSRARREALEGLAERLRGGESLRLLCWCAPRRCHAEDLARWLCAAAEES